MINFKNAFSLAEILTTLGIVGVAAVLAISSVNVNVNKKLSLTQANTAKHKVSQACEVMALQGKMKPYASTEAFINEFKKYIAINKVCTRSNITDCWTGKPVIQVDDSGNTYDIRNLRDGYDFRKFHMSGSDYSSSVMGVSFLDGTNMILNFNTQCKKLRPQIFSWIMNGEEPVLNEAATCLTGIIDANGSRGPGRVNHDVVYFNANGLGTTTCAFSEMGLCIGAPFYASPVTTQECIDRKGELGISDCMCKKADEVAEGEDACAWGYDYNTNDYWAGCVKECGGTSHVLTKSDTLKIFRYFYGYDDSSWDRLADGNYSTTNGHYTSGRPESHGFPSLPFVLWTNEEAPAIQYTCNYTGRCSYARTFESTKSVYYVTNRNAKSAAYCVCKI